MKKFIIVTLALIAALPAIVNAQIKVTSNGNVGIGLTVSPAEKLHINGSVRGNQTGALRINSGISYVDVGSKDICFAHFFTDRVQYYFDKKILISGGMLTSYGSADLKLCTGTAFNVKITVNNSTGNVGIGRSPHATYKLDVQGDVASMGQVLTSDIRLKDNIMPLEADIEKINLLNPITFTFKRPEIEKTRSDINDTTIQEELADPNNEQFYDQIRYGFSAQELQQVFPDFVSADENGFLSVNYVGMIPVLVDVLKEQHKQIESLQTLITLHEEEIIKIKKQLESLQTSGSTLKSTGSVSNENIVTTNSSAIYQNTPNPFTLDTKIEYFLADTVN
ncbi:MAG: tail fiber domain-containing protein, partial [Bacteroidales bacterium]|nr:tail fiber domain-containing protein [Bacteroidales bacterium]